MVSRLIISALLIILSVSPLNAADTYYVGRDEEGVFSHTDDYGGWYIDEVDLKGLTIYFSENRSL